MNVYYALIHKDSGSAYGVTFPDLPGCFSAADAETDIHAAAQEALVLYAQGETGIPQPRSMPDLQADPAIKAELAAGAVLMAVPLIVVARRARYNVMLDVDLVAGVDRQARVAGTSRSEFLSAALKDRLKATAGAAVVYRSDREYAVRQAPTGRKSKSSASKTKDVTGKAAASKAGKIPHDPKASPAAKSAGASALAETPARKAPAKKT